MLPYFAFAPPKDETENVARSEDLLINSQAALKYYHRLFQQEKVFDEFFVAGWSPSFQLGYHSPGSASQANPPLPPELLPALAAMRFFDAERPIDQGAGNPTYICSRSKPDALTWLDLPPVSDNRRTESGERFGQLLSLGAWRDTYRPTFGVKYGLLRAAPGKWWKNQGVRQSQVRCARDPAGARKSR